MNGLGDGVTLKLTAAQGDAKRLATQAVKEGFDTVVAAGGDGTLNEVLNGIGDADGGFQRARLGVLPLGTVNVFARELGISSKFEDAWKVLQGGQETKIDLPWVEHDANGKSERRYFAQLAGAGLDARAIELVKWQVKKLVGPLAYVAAGLHALLGPGSTIQVEGGGECGPGELVLIGNGRLYGGEFRLFPGADLRDGLLEVCVLPKVNWMTLARCSPGLLLNRCLPASATRLFRAKSFTLSSSTSTPVQVDGEMAGHLPAKFGIEPLGLRVVIPK